MRRPELTPARGRSPHADQADTTRQGLIGGSRLSKHAGRPFGDLSGGQQQRLSIALSLVGQPQIAVLDELTTGLDPNARRATWELVREIRDAGVTVVLVTHYMDEAEYLCDRLAIIRAGRVAATGHPDDLSRGGEERYLIRLPVGADQELLGTHVHLGVVAAGETDSIEVTGGPAALTRILTRLAGLGITPTSVQTRSRNLDDAYTEITNEDL